MSRLIAIDPGTQHYGVACFSSSLLESAFLVGRGAPFVTFLQGYFPVDRIVIEKPQIYFKRLSDQNDLIEVAIAAGEAGAYASSVSGAAVQYVRPADWKGQLTKTITTARIRKELAPEELEQVVLPHAEKTLAHNVWDAVGIGLWALGRMKRSPGLMKRKGA